MEQYLQLLKTIKEKGTYKPAARENMPGTKSLFGYQFRHNLANGFPLLTTKKINFKHIVVELIWFLRGDTNIKYLVDNGVNIWNEDAYNYYCKILDKKNIDHRSDNPKHSKWDFEGFVNFIKSVKDPGIVSFDEYKTGDCGFQYGKVWRSWETNKERLGDNGFYTVDQITNLIYGLKNSPEGRRHIVTAWDPAHDKDLALTWCHAMFQFNCRPLTLKEREDIAERYFLEKGDRKEIQSIREKEGIDFDQIETCHIFLDEEKIPKYYLDCQMYQRSADVFLGVPYNIASYALLTHIIAKMCNMIPGEYIHTFGDVHIYDNHKDAVEEQLSRTPTELPKLIFDGMTDEVFQYTDIDVFLKFVENESERFQLIDYTPQPAIKAELSTGMKK